MKFNLFKENNELYELVDSTSNDIETIIDYKCNNIFEYDYDLEPEEKKKIRKYVENDILVEIDNFKMIKVGNKLVGTVGVIDYEDGKMIDEIFIEESYRNKGIGTAIITDVLDKYDRVYLWGYKDNERAVNLYKRLGFVVKEDNDKRYFMLKSKS